jgi:glycosyltransferase involved in cell wall biosynthesis
VISVIIPVYNAEKWIERCVQSVQNNTYQEIEIICVNDGSTDHSLAILEKMKEKDDRIVIVDQKNAGVSAARNAGMSIARGGEIAFIDADDWVHTRYFEVLHTMLKESDADVASCRFLRTNQFCANDCRTRTEEKYNVISGKEAFSDFGVKAYVWGKLYRTDLFMNLAFDVNLKFGEDTAFNFLAYQNCKEVAVTNQKLYFYYYNSNSASNTVNGCEMFKRAYFCLEHMNDAKEEFKEEFLLDALKLALAYRYELMFTSSAKAAKREAIEIYCRAMQWKHYLARKERMQYALLIHIPPLYRFYRIAANRTMLAWEKNQKQRRKESRK